MTPVITMFLEAGGLRGEMMGDQGSCICLQAPASRDWGSRASQEPAALPGSQPQSKVRGLVQNLPWVCGLMLGHTHCWKKPLTQECWREPGPCLASVHCKCARGHSISLQEGLGGRGREMMGNITLASACLGGHALQL